MWGVSSNWQGAVLVISWPSFPLPGWAPFFSVDFLACPLMVVKWLQQHQVFNLLSIKTSRYREITSLNRTLLVWFILACVRSYAWCRTKFYDQKNGTCWLWPVVLTPKPECMVNITQNHMRVWDDVALQKNFGLLFGIAVNQMIELGAEWQDSLYLL